MVAVSTHCFVKVCSSDNHLLVLMSVAVCKNAQCPIRTTATQSSEFFDFVSKWNTLQNLSKRSAFGITIQSNQKKMNPQLVDNILNKGNQSCKELCLLHDDDTKLLEKCRVNVAELIGSDTGSTSSIVCCHFIRCVSDVCGVFDNKNGNAQCRIPRYDTQNTTRLAREHRTNKDFQRHVCIGLTV